MKTGIAKVMTCCVLLTLAGKLHASDGVLEINQACAINGGCMDGDSAGFPVTITQPGSYLLTSNLTLASADDSGIIISASHVQVDLNGFAIQGVSECTGTPVTSCTPVAGNFADDGMGVGSVSGSGVGHITVRNGSITGMGKHGVRLGMNAHVINVKASGNAALGAFISGDGILRGCTLVGNGGSGINVNGIFGDPDNQLALIQDNVLSQNGENGIMISNIAALVTGNTAANNAERGFSLTSNSAYTNNVVLANGTGTIVGGVNAGNNVCDGSATCP